MNARVRHNIAAVFSSIAVNRARPAVSFGLFFVTLLSLLPSGAALAENGAFSMTRTSPRWAVEVKGGLFEPDLDEYETFYGSDDTGYWGLAGAFRIYNWLEIMGELGFSQDNGTGALINTGTQGGSVEYTLVPAQLLVNFRYDATFDQLFVPYLGVGIAAAYYRQDIDQQNERTG
ncbi:MAG: hypothetical protein ACR2P6_01900, partial [Gammaproteobacteria bacterium]